MIAERSNLGVVWRVEVEQRERFDLRVCVEGVPLHGRDTGSLSCCCTFRIKLNAEAPAIEFIGDLLQRLSGSDAWIHRAEGLVALKEAPKATTFCMWKGVVSELQTTSTSHGILSVDVRRRTAAQEQKRSHCRNKLWEGESVQCFNSTRCH